MTSTMPSTLPPLTVVFDLDGTLADTSADLIAAANACFARRQLAVRLDPVVDAAIAFQGGRAMLRAGFSRAFPDRDEAETAPLVEEDFPFLLAHYGENLDRHTRLYPGVDAALDRLAEAGHALAVCTNKPEGLARALLARLGILDRFVHLTGADTYPWRKPDPRPLMRTIEAAGGVAERAVLVGDTATDRDAAAAAGVPCLLVTFGPLGRSVASLMPDGLLHGFDAIEEALGRLRLLPQG